MSITQTGIEAQAQARAQRDAARRSRQDCEVCGAPMSEHKPTPYSCPEADRAASLLASTGTRVVETGPPIKATIGEPVPAGSPPSRHAMPEVPPGKYAVRDRGGKLHFYKVDIGTTGRWVGFVFLEELAGPKSYPVKDHARKRGVLQLIAEDPGEASRTYGREIGVCGVCGIRLTKRESRLAGIGPVCAEKQGW